MDDMDKEEEEGVTALRAAALAPSGLSPSGSQAEPPAANAVDPDKAFFAAQETCLVCFDTARVRRRECNGVDCGATDAYQAAKAAPKMLVETALADIATMMGEFVENWPDHKKFDTSLALIAKTIRASRSEVADLLEALVRCAEIVERNLYRQSEKVEDVPRIARAAIARPRERREHTPEQQDRSRTAEYSTSAGTFGGRTR